MQSNNNSLRTSSQPPNRQYSPSLANSKRNYKSTNSPKCSTKRVTIVTPAHAAYKREIRKLEKPQGGRKKEEKLAVAPDKSPTDVVAATANNKSSSTSFKVAATTLKFASDYKSAVGPKHVNMARRPFKALPVGCPLREQEDLTKKVEKLLKINEELKNKELALSATNESVRQEEKQKHLEVEKVVRYWTMTRQQLEEEQERNVALEKWIQQMRTAHIEQVSLLHKRISMLQLKAEIRRVSVTQTDPFGTDSDASLQHSVAVQTTEAWTAQRAHDALRLNDGQLVELIADMEHQKLKAQTDFKFAVVQIEQRLREQHEDEVRAIKEDRERQVEDNSRIQNDRILADEQTNAQMKKHFIEQIIEQKVQIIHLSEKLSDAEAEVRSLTADASHKEKTYKRMTAENETLNRKVRSNQVELGEAKRVGQVARQLRIRLEKIEEINEILLGEFQKVENERNYYVKQLYSTFGAQNQNTQQKSYAHEYAERLDAIRQKYGGLHL